MRSSWPTAILAAAYAVSSAVLNASVQCPQPSGALARLIAFVPELAIDRRMGAQARPWRGSYFNLLAAIFFLASHVRSAFGDLLDGPFPPPRCRRGSRRLGSAVTHPGCGAVHGGMRTGRADAQGAGGR
jgi:hypothetical protein